ncbi:hypothetical protein [Nocardioides sp.]|uniref:hypothetical protein n=1 Tax=Nocardioides sp. TaxID=35761 RepID=UPI002CD23ABF|nr:hypothetical protein [Nocardioides sp.]HXH80243.1 hypothetical protein [Nocardioides sp.]
MTWNSHHRRGEILRTVIAEADARQDGCLPMDVNGVAETFGDEHTLLGALQLRWHTRLAGRIERELMSQPMDLEAAVIAAWHSTASELPGILAIIDHYRAEPVDDEMAAAMEVSTGKEHHLLAVMAGRSSASDAPSARVGAEIAQRARTRHAPAARTLTRPAPSTLVERIRAVLTAA